MAWWDRSAAEPDRPRPRDRLRSPYEDRFRDTEPERPSGLVIDTLSGVVVADHTKPCCDNSIECHRPECWLTIVDGRPPTERW